MSKDIFAYQVHFFADRNQTTENGSCVKVRSESFDVWGSSCRLPYAHWQPIAQWIVIALAIVSLIKEV